MALFRYSGHLGVDVGWLFLHLVFGCRIHAPWRFPAHDSNSFYKDTSSKRFCCLCFWLLVFASDGVVDWHSICAEGSHFESAENNGEDARSGYCANAGGGNHRSANEKPYAVRQETSDLLRYVLLKQVHFEAVHPVTSKDSLELQEYVESGEALIMAFNHLNSEHDLDVLASLGSYYLGEGPHETYTCVVLNKGHRIKPHLRNLLNSKPVCAVDLAKTQAATLGRLCLSTEIFRASTKSMVDQIDHGEKCSADDM